MNRKLGVGTAFVAAAMLVASNAGASDLLKVAAGGHGNWDSSPCELGSRAGIFKKHGIGLDILYTAGSGETLQAVISGAADIGIALGTGSVMGAYVKGAPIRIIGAVTTGANDVYWYTRSNSPLKSLDDANAQTTIAYSSSGSSTFVLAQEILKVHHVNAAPTRTGGPAGTLTQVMSGQIDVGYATAPFALKQVGEGQIRVLAHGGEIPGADDQTVRVIAVNAKKLAANRDVIARFMRAYAETVDWMYSDPKALEIYSAYSKVPVEIAKQGMTEFYSRKMLDPYRVSGLDQVMADSIKLKLLKSALTADQLADILQVPRPKN
ncbi:MAG TPA: ABC transporter substrate-binding protein [Pseudolabrys sp.]|nr:ABC transporter substrate-binding protein [Pseudolabrys sp.]